MNNLLLFLLRKDYQEKYRYSQADAALSKSNETLTFLTRGFTVVSSVFAVCETTALSLSDLDPKAQS